ncbi:MAG: MotA/TolQ/ExbB proton channel family protein [Proteobacteria bacterium]|nr:MotA/TolQ/ExbB proton channel family protein [Pseudomonadota bacterium]
MTEPITQLSGNSFLTIILQGGVISVAILAVLLFMSVLSWAVIGWKWMNFRVAVKQAGEFLKNLNLTKGAAEAKQRAEANISTYYAKEFQAAYLEYVETYRRQKQVLNPDEKPDFLLRVERSIEKCILNESLDFEKSLVILATISSSAPFIGLFGTVTGIIDAFYSIGSQGAASIAVVAPGISAALVATAFGLFAAIPALMAYNVFRNKSRIIRQQMEAFGFDLINLFDREYTKAVTHSKSTRK